MPSTVGRGKFARNLCSGGGSAWSGGQTRGGVGGGGGHFSFSGISARYDKMWFTLSWSPATAPSRWSRAL
jgi:hypothetical protein